MRRTFGIPWCCFLLVFFLFTGISVHAGEVNKKSDGSTVWQAGIDGVEIEWGADGSFNRIYSLFSSAAGCQGSQFDRGGNFFVAPLPYQVYQAFSR